MKITATLMEMMEGEQHFIWTKKREATYQQISRTMTPKNIPRHRDSKQHNEEEEDKQEKSQATLGQHLNGYS